MSGSWVAEVGGPAGKKWGRKKGNERRKRRGMRRSRRRRRRRKRGKNRRGKASESMGSELLCDWEKPRG